MWKLQNNAERNYRTPEEMGGQCCVPGSEDSVLLSVFSKFFMYSVQSQCLFL